MTLQAGCFNLLDVISTDLVIPIEILARGPDAEMAYWRALRNGKVRVNRASVMLVGQDRAGKTSLKKSLLGMPFDPYQASTEGVEVDPSVFEVQIDQVTNWQRVEDNKMKSQLDDELARMVAGELQNAPTEPEENGRNEERNQPLATDEDVVDSSKEEEIETVEMKSGLASKVETSNEDQIMNDVTTNGTASMQQIDIKLDISNTIREHATKRAIQYLQNQKLDEAVDRKETIVTIWDFAGQRLYYASHPVFFSPRAINVLVYNLSKDLKAKAQPCVRQGVHDFILENTTNETNLENILSWLVSIHNVSVPEDDFANSEGVKRLSYMRPPVVIVGTHSDCAHEEPKRAEACIKKSISCKTFGQHVVRPFFVVNNTLSSSDAGVENLRHKINELLQLEPYMGEDVPIRWFNFEKVTEFFVETKTLYLDLTQLEQIVREVCLIEDENEVTSMLNFYQDLGVIIKYGKTVVLQAQWLISLFKKLIAIRPYDEQDPKFSHHWEKLEKRGILYPELIDHVFSGFISDGQSREDILNMMELYGLIARFGNNGKEESTSLSCLGFKDAKYFVPAQLRTSPDELLDVQPSEKDPCALYVHFLDGFLPHGLFPQVVSRFIKWCSVTGCRHDPSLYLNGARFILGHNGTHDLVLIRRKRFIKVVIKTLKLAAADTIQSRDDGKPSLINITVATKPWPHEDSISSPAVEARKFLEEALEKLKTETPWLRHMNYELAMLCTSCAAPDKQCDKHKQNGCLDDECLHLLGIHYEEVLICENCYGDKSRVPNIAKAWFTHEEFVKNEDAYEKKNEATSHGNSCGSSDGTVKECAENEDVYEKKKETTLQGNPCASSVGEVEECVENEGADETSTAVLPDQELESVKNKEAYTKKKMVFLASASAKVLAFIAMLAVAVFCFRSPGSVVDRDQLPPITSTRSPTSASKSLASTSSGGPSCVIPRGSGSSKEEYCKENAITEKVQSATKSEISGQIKKLKVVLLSIEWGSSKGGLSTFNRQLAIYLAKRSDLEVSCYLPEVSDHDKNTALKDNVTLFEAEDIPGNKDPFVKLQHWPAKEPPPDVIISHGRKFGPAAYHIMKKYKEIHPSCKWVHFVHVNYEEMGKYKVGSNEIRANNRKYKEELWFCQKADVVVAVGPQLLDCYSRSLSIEQKEVQVFYPGLSKEFQNLLPKNIESTEFHIYIFCRCSSEDFELKGVDLLADAVGKLGKKYKMHVVGVPEDEEVNIFQHTLEKTAVTKNQLYVWEYCNDREDLKRLMGKADVVVMPSRAEAFGLIGLEALSAGVPLLVSATAGLGMTLKELTFGDICVVESDDHDFYEWAKKIELLKEKERPQRIKRMEQLRNQYDEKYKWDEQCSILAKLF